MKNGFMKRLALVLACVLVVSSLSACGEETTGTTTTDTTVTPAATDEVTPAADPAGTGDVTVDTTEEEDKVLVVGYSQFASKFSPFFATLAYDQDVVDLVSMSLLGQDREGNIVLKGIEGEVIPYNGTDYTYTGIADCDITQNDDGSVVYDFTMRDDIKFSDGTPVTADDVIFSMYVLADPTYDGASTFYTLPIRGMEEYRGGMVPKMDLIVEAGQDNTDFTFFTEEEQNLFWGEGLQAGGEAFAMDIVNYCMANYLGSYADVYESLGNSDIAFGMYLWGFADIDADGNLVGAGTDTVYDSAAVTAADYWTEICAVYENDYAAISDTEQANGSLWSFISEAYPEFAAGVSTGDSAANIEGIEKTGDYSVRVTMDSFDAVAIYQLPVTIAPLHYYGDKALYDYDNNMFGFNKGDMSLMKAKSTQPLGAGPYKFVSYENGIVTFEANENYYNGEPKIKYVQFKETPDTDKLTGIATGTFDISDPSMSSETLKALKSYNSNGEVTGDVLETNLVDNLGYGYIGISANNVKVGDDSSSYESKCLRKAFATVFAVYRDTVINSYYGEMATVIQYPISNTSWAAPKPADEGYALAYSTDAFGFPIYSDGMTDEEKAEAATYAAKEYLIEAGYTWDEDACIFTDAPEGASMTYEIIVPADGVGDHPAYGIATAAKEAFASLGITLQINDPSDQSVWNDALEANTAEMWAAAWGATSDPDMYQVYHSDNANGQGTNSNHYAIQDADLDAKIIEARNSADQSFRKATYKECLEIILDWGVEIPTYQRQNAIVFNVQRVNTSTLTPDITTFWGWMNDIEKLEMN